MDKVFQVLKTSDKSCRNIQDDDQDNSSLKKKVIDHAETHLFCKMASSVGGIQDFIIEHREVER